jgi:glutamyl-tRNA synthetase
VFTLEEMVAEFSFARVSTVGPVFDVDKLDWLNGVYLRSLSDAEFLNVAEPFLPAGVRGEDLGWVLTAVKERTKKLSELPEQLDWLAADAVEVPVGEITGQLDADAAAGVLSAAAAALDTVEPFEPEMIEKALGLACAESGLSRRRVFMSVRLAVTGKRVSPPLHETIAALGHARATTRLRAAATAVAS